MLNEYLFFNYKNLNIKKKLTVPSGTAVSIFVSSMVKKFSFVLHKKYDSFIVILLYENI